MAGRFPWPDADLGSLMYVGLPSNLLPYLTGLLETQITDHDADDYDASTARAIDTLLECLQRSMTIPPDVAQASYFLPASCWLSQHTSQHTPTTGGFYNVRTQILPAAVGATAYAAGWLSPGNYLLRLALRRGTNAPNVSFGIATVGTIAPLIQLYATSEMYVMYEYNYTHTAPADVYRFLVTITGKEAAASGYVALINGLAVARFE